MRTATVTATEQAYLHECSARGVQPNSALKHSLYVGGGSVQVLDLSDNLLGPRGLSALQTSLPSFATTLHTLILSDNGLTNEAVVGLSRQLASGFPALRVVNLSGNPFTFQAAKHLAWMCEGVAPSRDGPAPSPPAPSLSLTVPEGTDTSLALSPALLFEHRLSLVGADNNIEQVVLEEMPLLSQALCECVLRRIDAAIQRRQDRKRKLKAFQRQARRRSTAAVPGAVAGTPDRAGEIVEANSGGGVEEEFPDDVARTPSAHGMDGGHGSVAQTPVAFFKQEAEGRLQVDVGLPKAPQIPQVLLQRRSAPMTRHNSDQRTAPSPVAPRDAMAEGTATATVSAATTSLSPQRPPRPGASPRSTTASIIQPALVTNTTNESEDADEAADGEGSEGLWTNQHPTEDATVAYADASHRSDGEDATDNHNDADDWLFTGALEPLNFTPPGPAAAAPPTDDYAIPALDVYPFESLGSPMRAPAPQVLAAEATPGFLDDLQFDLGAMDEGGNDGSAWMGSAGTPTTTQQQRAEDPQGAPLADALFAAEPQPAAEGGAPSWLEF